MGCLLFFHALLWYIRAPPHVDILCREEQWTIMRSIAPTPSPWFSSSYFFKWTTLPHPIHGLGVDWVVCWFFMPYYGASMLPFTLLCCVYTPPCIFCADQGGAMKNNEKCCPCHGHGFHLHHLFNEQPPSPCFVVLVLFGLLVGFLCLVMERSCSPSCHYALLCIVVLHNEEWQGT